MTKRIDPMQLIRPRHSSLVGAAVCVLALSLAACGGSSSKSSSPTPSTSTGGSTAAAATGGTPTTSGSSGTTTGSSGGTFNACSLLTTTKLSALAGHPYTTATPKTIANGQDSCDYANTAAFIDLTVIVYQSNSGVSLDTMRSVQTGAGTVTDISGVGDKAIAGPIELDIQVGDRLVAIEGAGSSGSSSVAIAVGKAIVAALG